MYKSYIIKLFGKYLKNVEHELENTQFNFVGL